MRARLTPNIHSPFIDRFSPYRLTPYLASYAALLLDLLAAPLLLWRRTRLATLCLVVFFHILNEQFFPIGVFPWLAIAGITTLLSPSWPHRIMSLVPPTAAMRAIIKVAPYPHQQQILV